MPAALLVFKLSVQSFRQLQQHKIEVSFEITGLPYQWTVANHSILKQGSLQLGAVEPVGWFWRISVPHCTSHDNPMDWEI